jgi:hypothetical protein
MKKIFIILILIALTMTACKSTGAKANVEATKRILDATSSAGAEGTIVVMREDDSSTKTSGEQALQTSGAVIIIQRSGGLVGVNEQWSFYPDGKIVKDYMDQEKPSETYNVDAAQVTALLAALKTAGFFDMEASSGIGGLSNCKDCFTYQLSAASEGTTNSITFQEGATGPQEEIEKVINQLIRLAGNPQ